MREDGILYSRHHENLIELNVQYLPPNYIIGFLEVYEGLMYCRIVTPLCLQYLTNQNIGQ
jgi:hypothetical protein